MRYENLRLKFGNELPIYDFGINLKYSEYENFNYELCKYLVCAVRGSY